MDVDRAAYRGLLATHRADLARALERLQARRGRIVIVVEGRDGAGKTGAIRRLVKELPPSLYRVVRLGAPERGAPYLARWREVLETPTTCIVLDRSWYNRAALEPVMGYCTAAESAAFLDDVPAFERELVCERGILLVKLFLDVSREEQARRLARRRS
jgi:polyphosphate kinase 2 (PPK2 family)